MEIIAIFEAFFYKVWNVLYKLLCEKFGEEVNHDWIVDTTTPNVD